MPGILTRGLRRPAALLVIALLAAVPAAAQDRPNDEPSSFDPLMERSDLGNVRQAALLAYHAGRRDLDRARKLDERAIEQLTDAVRTNPKLAEAYDPLGRALLATGKAQDALEVYGASLRVAPDDWAHKEGLAEALLGTGRVRDAANAYQTLRDGHEESADRLLAAMKRWVSERRERPAENVPPEVVDALATLIQQWEAEG